MDGLKDGCLVTVFDSIEVDIFCDYMVISK